MPGSVRGAEHPGHQAGVQQTVSGAAEKPLRTAGSIEKLVLRASGYVGDDGSESIQQLLDVIH
jgi:hypothetical protein